MSGRSAIFTIVAKNYLPYARVLMQSLRQWAPGLRQFVILVDRVDGFFDPAREDFQIILSDQLDIPDSRRFHFKYSILELSTAVKPYAFEFLFRTYGLDKLIYLDPDIKVYAPLDPLVESLGRHPMVLTPHLTEPLDDDRRPGELDILRSGTYNLGFLALSWAPDTQRFLGWWQARLYDQCVVDLPSGLFVDQRWMDLAPGLFPGVHINREPGYNVAYWNLGGRRIRRLPDGYSVNGQPLYFFHFSGLSPRNPQGLSRHQNRHRITDLGDGESLVLDYARDLLSCGYEQCGKWPYAYGHFDNGVAIPDAGRALHHESPETAARAADPFSDDGFEAFLKVWNQPVAELAPKEPPISRLAYRIYKCRPDVETLMPDVFGKHRIRFLEWMLTSGRSEHRLDEAFLSPALEGLRAPESPIGSDQGVMAPITRLVQVIWRSRPDLQQAFPDPCGADSAKFLAWAFTYGKREYEFGEENLAPLRRQVSQLPWSPDGIQTRLLWRLYRAGMAVKMAASSYQPVRSPEPGKGKIECVPPPAGTNGTRPHTIAPDLGINVFGYVQAPTGVGEIARSSIASAKAVNIEASVYVVEWPCQPAGLDSNVQGASGEGSHPFNLFHVNADQLPHVLSSLNGRRPEGAYNIGYWAWELEEFPDRWVPSYSHLDEIWTLSSFCQDAIARKSGIPVLRMPPAVSVKLERAYTRSYFGLPENKFLLLTIFDVFSVPERKNPLAAIEAFARAYPDGGDCHLAIKVNHGGQRPDYMRLIAGRAAGLNVTILDSTMSRADANGLLSVCDCLLSLHRSEGFGLTLAEAMYLGKPVIATGYSGNLDFTRPDNSFLVGYRLQAVGKGCEPYDEHCLWADPVLDDAVEHIRTVAAHSGRRSEVARKGQEFVRTFFSPEAVGAQMRARLQRLQDLRGGIPSATAVAREARLTARRMAG